MAKENSRLLSLITLVLPQSLLIVRISIVNNVVTEIVYRMDTIASEVFMIMELYAAHNKIFFFKKIVIAIVVTMTHGDITSVEYCIITIVSVPIR
jgi:hypothetical protein